MLSCFPRLSRHCPDRSLRDPWPPAPHLCNGDLKSQLRRRSGLTEGTDGKWFGNCKRRPNTKEYYYLLK